MPRFMVEAARARSKRNFPGAQASAFGHLGDGNVHFHVRAGSRAADDWYEREAPAVTRFVHDLVTAAGGSISAEHGIGQMKKAELERLSPPSRLFALKAIKHALDPPGPDEPRQAGLAGLVQAAQLMRQRRSLTFARIHFSDLRAVPKLEGSL